MPPPATIRIARPTSSIPALLPFYVDGLGLQILGSFNDHEGFDGVMLGHPDYSWHLEFTYQHGVVVAKAPTKEHLLVFYEHRKIEYEALIERVEKGGWVKVQSENPYWDKCGVTFEDPEGWRIVVQNAAWP